MFDGTTFITRKLSAGKSFRLELKIKFGNEYKVKITLFQYTS
jgi:hypothetical protein